MKYYKYILLIIGLFSLNVNATEWTLDTKSSQINFISIKKNKVAEIHQFASFNGLISSTGQVEVDIDLTSVDTSIDVRNERMKAFLFEVEQFPKATLKATIEPDVIDAIPLGGSTVLEVKATLSLHGKQVPLTLDVVATRLVGAKLSVVSSKPTIIKANDFELVAGINTLREIAKLPSIAEAVPVSFYLTFGLD